MQKLVFYTTEGCHLCESAEALLSGLIDATGVEVEVVDISESESLVDLYGIRIPVVKNASTELEVSWPFGEEQLRDLLT